MKTAVLVGLRAKRGDDGVTVWHATARAKVYPGGWTICTSGDTKRAAMHRLLRELVESIGKVSVEWEEGSERINYVKKGAEA